MAPESEVTSPVKAPPALRLWEMLTLTDHTDENGRLLLEDSAPEEAIEKVKSAGIPMETVESPYHDTPSRDGGSINMSAYEALRKDTAAILSGFAWLAEKYFARNPRARGKVRGLLDMSHLGLNLPLILFGRGANPVSPHGSLPSFIAAIFKASRGVYSAGVEMLEKKGASALVDASDAVEFADRHGSLKRPETGRACAAPTKLIEHTLSVMMADEQADAAKSSLETIVDFDMLWNFYTTDAALNETLNAYGSTLKTLMANGPISDPNALFSARVYDNGKSRTFGEYTEITLRKATRAQKELNRILGRNESAPPPKFEDLLQMV